MTSPRIFPSWKNLGVYATGMPSLLGAAPTTFVTTPVARPMKVVDLVTHTSGLTYGFMNRTNVDAAYRRLGISARDTEAASTHDRAIVQRCRWSSRRARGGTIRWRSTCMGYLVQKLSGMTFGEFLRTRLFETLGMTDTAFWCPPESSIASRPATSRSRAAA